MQANRAINYSPIACITGVTGGSQVGFGARAQSVKHAIPCFYLSLFPDPLLYLVLHTHAQNPA